jgi:hypothetical protein
MSTPTRAELAGKIGQLKVVSEQLIRELKILDDRVGGLFAFIQTLPDYEETVEKLKEKAKENEEKVQ